jgi:hypothetical protein
MSSAMLFVVGGSVWHQTSPITRAEVWRSTWDTPPAQLRAVPQDMMCHLSGEWQKVFTEFFQEAMGCMVANQMLPVMPGTVVHACNPSYVGGRDCGSRLACTNSTPYLNQLKKKVSMGVHRCHSSCEGSIHRKIGVQASSVTKSRPYLKKQLKQKGLLIWSSGSAPI